MPSSLTYPGVYIEEIPSGVRTITGVATSIAAFIGWAPKGPTDRAELLLSWSDFERKFGGLDKRTGCLAVSAFFANGGQRLRGPSCHDRVNDGNRQRLRGRCSIPIDRHGERQRVGPNAIVTKKRADDATRFSSSRGIKLDRRHSHRNLRQLSMKLDDHDRSKPSSGRDRCWSPRKCWARAGTDPPADTVIPTSGASRGLTPISWASMAAPGSKDGATAFVAAGKLGDASGTEGVFLLDRIDLFNLLCAGLGDTTASAASEVRAPPAFLVADCANRHARRSSAGRRQPHRRQRDQRRLLLPVGHDPRSAAGESSGRLSALRLCPGSTRGPTRTAASGKAPAGTGPVSLASSACGRRSRTRKTEC